MKTRALRREEDGAGSTRVGHPRGRAGWVGALVPGLSGDPANLSVGNSYSLPHAQLTAELLFTLCRNRILLSRVTKGERWEGRKNGELGYNIYTLLYIKQVTNMDLLYSTGNSAKYSVII